MSRFVASHLEDRSKRLILARGWAHDDDLHVHPVAFIAELFFNLWPNPSFPSDL